MSWSPIDDAEREAVDRTQKYECCAAVNALFMCTRPRDHQGDHIAGGSYKVCARWPQEKNDATESE